MSQKYTLMSQKYTLTLNTRQAEVVAAALDLYARIGIAQFSEIVTIYEAASGFKSDSGKLQAATRLIADAKAELTGYSENAGPSIMNPEVNDTFRVAYDVKKVLQYRVAWTERPEGGFGVNYDRPEQTSKEPLATASRYPDGDPAR